MSIATEELLDAVLALPDEDRLEFVEAIAASLQPADQPVLDPAWLPVIKRRSQEMREGKDAGVPWSEVKRRTREKYGD